MHLPNSHSRIDEARTRGFTRASRDSAAAAPDPKAVGRCEIDVHKTDIDAPVRTDRPHKL